MTLSVQDDAEHGMEELSSSFIPSSNGSSKQTIVVIGAGPAGLVTCKSLIEAATPEHPFDPIVFEQEDDIGGTFRYRSYEVRVWDFGERFDSITHSYTQELELGLE